MNKNAIFSYVEYAREELQKSIKQKAFEYGITADGAKSGLTVINGKVLSKEEIKERDILISTIESSEDGKGFSNGYELVMEEVAYTWFNRFIALRFMEVNGYLPSHTRVFSDENGRSNPQILKEALTLDIPGIDRLKVSEMVQDNLNDELFKYLIILQCNALSKPLPKMFEKIENYTELLFPNGLLKKGSIIDKLVTDINEEDWKDQVQIIGWMYQFYVASKREAYRKESVITKKHIPTLSQIFTPDWIVRYMAENSIGRIWLESYPSSSIKSEMKYYVDDAKQEDEVLKRIDEIKYKNVNPEEIKIIEPCCGSGHILVYCFDLLYKMYLEKGYLPRDIATLILKNNLYGLDIDKRAAQLAYFSVMMKARSVDKQFLNRENVQQPNIYEIIESQLLVKYEYEALLKEYKFSDKSIGIVRNLVSTFKNAKGIGSLLKVNHDDYKYLIDELTEKENNIIPTLVYLGAWNICLPLLKQLASLAIIMSNQYDVIITNPPYLGISKLNAPIKEYLTKNYPDSKSDMFGMFMEVDYIKSNGFRALVNPDSWMFLVSFEQLRKKIIKNEYVVNMLHLGMGEFDATVQTTTFVLRNTAIPTNGVYFRLVDEKNKEAAFLAGGGQILTNILLFDRIPGKIIGYWISLKYVDIFKNKTVADYLSPKQGTSTGNNELFLREWWEVNNYNIYFYATDIINAFASGKRWFPATKGGEYRKWYGNNEFLVDWECDGKRIKNYNGSAVRNPNINFSEGLTWTGISSKALGMRYCPKGFVYLVSGKGIIGDEKYLKYILAITCSKVAYEILKITSPVLSFEVSYIGNIPVIINDLYFHKINIITNNNIEYSKNDWDSFEVSWDFNKHPLI